MAVLVPLVADAMNIADTYVEKDFWAMESLRAVTPFADKQGTPAIFKGGTSLSKAWHLTDRFSEDIDLVFDFPAKMGARPRDRILKGLAGAIGDYLGLDESAFRAANQNTGVARNVFITYPAEHPVTSLEVKAEVLLEMGSRGAPTPNGDVPLLSFVADYLIDQGNTEADYEELVPFMSHVLVPERTLIEKVGLLANRDEEFATGNADAFAGLGRHLYDLHALLTSEVVNDALDKMGPAGIAEVALDVHERSEKAKWASVQQPEEGWIATSGCFTFGTDSNAALEAAYNAASPLIYGTIPLFTECLQVLQEAPARI